MFDSMAGFQSRAMEIKEEGQWSFELGCYRCQEENLSQGGSSQQH